MPAAFFCLLASLKESPMAERAVIIIVDDESDALAAMLDFDKAIWRGLSRGALSFAMFCLARDLQEQGRK